MPSYPFFNVVELIRHVPGARVFEVGGMLFARFTCPVQNEPVGILAPTDHLIHVLSSTSTWKTSRGICSAGPGESVFFRKGAYVAPPAASHDICLLIFFLPDSIVRETVRELAPQLPPAAVSFDPGEVAIRVEHDVGLRAFIHAMADYFCGDQPPPEPLLKLKVKELITSILVGSDNRTLAAYFRSSAATQAPALEWIMEANFQHNLSIEEFAQLCHRSLSTFKRDFQQRYHTTPGKWLLERRLVGASDLLRTTTGSVTEIMLECGFEDLSHFSHAFKERFGATPSAYRESAMLARPE